MTSQGNSSFSSSSARTGTIFSRATCRAVSRIISLLLGQEVVHLVVDSFDSCSFTCGWSAYHRISADPQVNPAPKASRRTRSPGAARPSRTASSRAMGMVAPEVFP